MAAPAQNTTELDHSSAGLLRVARAVASATGLAVLRHIQLADGSVGVRELAETFGLHPNAVRKHLAQLRDAGLVVEEVERRPGGGRPRLVYRHDPESANAFAGWNPYELLAPLLVEVAAGRPAREVGAAYGQRLAASAPEEEPVALLAAVARRHGFQPTVERDGSGVSVLLGRCPFATSVSADRVVCDLHRGIAEGVAAASGTARVTALDTAPPHEGGCRLFITIEPAREDACAENRRVPDAR
jgi:predicted ArsR family transcriptional regulator